MTDLRRAGDGVGWWLGAFATDFLMRRLCDAMSPLLWIPPPTFTQARILRRVAHAGDGAHSRFVRARGMSTT